MAAAFQRAVVGFAIALGGASAIACLRAPVFACDNDAQCVLDDREGSCIDSFCAYPDDECDSAQRFGPAAGEGMAGECVPTDVSSSGSSDGNATEPGCDACDQPPDPCHLPAGSCEGGACVYPLAPSGTDCTGDDPCVHAAHCDGQGACVVDDATVCNDPPGPCHEPRGSCTAPGSCSYALRDAGTACEDGDGCTLGDRCDAAGSCESVAICPSDNPCAIGDCGPTGQCSFFPVADGTACGTQAVEVCCAGACVNLGDDEDNCGGCGVACTSSQSCSGRLTPMCLPA